MRGKADQATQAAAIRKVVVASAYAEDIRECLAAILASQAFRGSRRSQEFLRHVVEHALDGHFEDLNERSIGIAVFGRFASYDTGEDAIVRVTASDVRKRLLQYHLQVGSDSKFRIELVSGSYIPEFHSPEVKPDSLAELGARLDEEAHPSTRPPAPEPARVRTRTWISALPYIFGLAMMGLTAYLWMQNRELTRVAGARPNAAKSMLWSALLSREHRTIVVVADSAFAAIQDLTGTRISLSDYASRRFSFNFNNPGTEQAVNLLMKRQYTAVQDAVIVAGIAELAGASGHRIQVKQARNVQIQDFKTDDNFILLGSVAANPWSKLFEDELDYSLEFDTGTKRMVCRNKRPRLGEASSMVPTALAYATGDAYAQVAFFANPNQAGHILLLAGTIGEGTEAAGRFVTNTEILGQALRKVNVDPARGVRYFEALLRLKAMAGSPSAFEVVTFHAADKPKGR